MTLVGSAITLGLGAVVAIGLLAAGDMASDYFSGDYFLTFAVTLAVAAAPVALLLSWDEIDLSSFGTVALGSYVYVEIGDGAVLVGLIAAALAGLVIGAIIGVVRWLTDAHSALVTLGAGTLLSGLALRVGPGQQGVSVDGARIDGLGLPLLAMLVVVGVAVLLAVLCHQPDGGSPSAPPASAGPGAPGGSYAPVPAAPVAPTPGRAGLRVVPAFALTAMAGMLFGALQAGTVGFYGVGYYTLVPTLVFAAVAIGGVVRGSGPFAPLTAAVASGVVVLVQDATRFNGWEAGDQQLVLGALFVVCTAIAYGLRRVLTPANRPSPAPGTPF
jgi:hypothetical protein